MDGLDANIARRVRAQFEVLDSSGDGFLDKGELKELFTRLDLTLDAKDIDRLLADVDKDGDGQISIDEFLEGIFNKPVVEVKEPIKVLDLCAMDWDYESKTICMTGFPGQPRKEWIQGEWLKAQDDYWKMQGVEMTRMQLTGGTRAALSEFEERLLKEVSENFYDVLSVGPWLDALMLTAHGVFEQILATKKTRDAPPLPVSRMVDLWPVLGWVQDFSKNRYIGFHFSGPGSNTIFGEYREMKARVTKRTKMAYEDWKPQAKSFFDSWSETNPEGEQLGRIKEAVALAERCNNEELVRKEVLKFGTARGESTPLAKETFRALNKVDWTDAAAVKAILEPLQKKLGHGVRYPGRLLVEDSVAYFKIHAFQGGYDHDPSEPNPWWAAAAKANPETLNMFFKLDPAGMSFNNFRSDKTAYHIMAENGNAELMRASLKLLGNWDNWMGPCWPAIEDCLNKKIMGPGANGFTALHYAAEAGRAECVTLLLQHAADPNITDAEGKTPAQIAKGDAAGVFASPPACFRDEPPDLAFVWTPKVGEVYKLRCHSSQEGFWLNVDEDGMCEQKGKTQAEAIAMDLVAAEWADEGDLLIAPQFVTEWKDVPVPVVKIRVAEGPFRGKFLKLVEPESKKQAPRLFAAAESEDDALIFQICVHASQDGFPKEIREAKMLQWMLYTLPRREDGAQHVTSKKGKYLKLGEAHGCQKWSFHAD